jgi:hypothetical protein
MPRTHIAHSSARDPRAQPDDVVLLRHCRRDLVPRFLSPIARTRPASAPPQRSRPGKITRSSKRLLCPSTRSCEHQGAIARATARSPGVAQLSTADLARMIHHGAGYIVMTS